ncbi:MAG: ABC transporter permease [Acidobacteriia bacterium]|nr:ABC transporter permease [Terriglobia bacterium]
MRFFGRRRRRTQEIRGEIDRHLQMAEQDRTERGDAPEEARHAVQREFGNLDLIHDVTRDLWGGRWLEHLLQDIRYGARMLRKNPAFTAVAVVTLGLGIGAVTAIISVVNGFLFRPLPYRDPARLVVLHSRNLRGVLAWMGNSLPDFDEWRGSNHTFEGMAAYAEDSFNLSFNDRPERVQGTAVSASLFSLLGVAPVLGRGIYPDEDRADGAGVVVLGHDLWRHRFGADPAIIGRTVRVNAHAYTVIGVMPPEFKFYEFADFWIPLSGYAGTALRDRGARAYEVIARLKPGASLEQAQAEIDILAQNLAHSFPQTNSGVAVDIVRLEQERKEFGSAIPLLLGAVGFVLLIVCANVANLLIARGVTRQKEMAIRIAVGAGRLRLIRQLLTESIMLSLLGGILGVVIALGASDLIVASIPVKIPFWLKFKVDGRVLALTFLIVAITGLLVGLLPALDASRMSANDQLKEGGVAPGGRRGRRFRSVLVVSQIGFALVLMCGAGVLIRSFLRLQAVNVGLNPTGVVTMHVELPTGQYPQPRQVNAFQNRMLERIQKLPGVESLALFTSAQELANALDLPGQGTNERRDAPPVNIQSVSPDYFRVMDIPLRSGRVFTDQDTATSAGVIIVSELAARRFWPRGNFIGQQLNVSNTNLPDTLLTVIGVVGDTSQPGLYSQGVGLRAGLDLYVSLAQHSGRAMTLAVRTPAPPERFAAGVRTMVQEINPELPIFNVQSMERRVFGGLWPLRALTQLLGIFAGVGLLLACVGIYGVVLYSVSQRTLEMGIRMALGAKRSDVLKLIVGEGVMLAMCGAGIGLIAAFALTQMMSSLLFGVSATDPAVFLGVAFLLVATALLASYIPARRAMRADPMAALRVE